jgi:hypothetical protein
VTYPYGPIPAYIYAGVAGLFGNTPDVYLYLLATISAVNAGLAYALVRRAANRFIALFVSVGLIALLAIPGAIAGAFTVSPYLVLERTLLLLAALCWKPPTDRSFRSALALGCVLGIWQGIKFGGAAFAGAAIVVLDALYLAILGFPKSHVRAWIRGLLAMVAAFFLVESAWALWATLSLPCPVALDLLWPSHMFSHYRVVTPDIRWPRWGGWSMLFGQYLLPVVGGLLGAGGLVSWLRRTRGAPDEMQRHLVGASGTVFLPLCFYVVASVAYFQHVYHFQQYLWALIPAAAW